MPEPFDVPRDVLVDAMAEYMRGLLTPPLTLAAVAKEFEIHRSTARGLVESIPGCQQHGAFWRIPVCQMPIAYQRRVGLL